MDTVELRSQQETTPGVIVEKTPLRRGPLGDLLIREGLITASQLEDALRVQEDLEPRTPLGHILVAQQAITQKQLNQVLDRYHKKYRLGDILVETQKITDDQLKIALNHQKKTGLRLGDVLQQLNFVTEEQLNQAFCTQFGATFVDLDRLLVDRSLASLVDKSYAQQHRVIPIFKFENNIALVMDDPSDLAVVEELEASTGCKINVVTSTHAAFRRAFIRAYGESPEDGLARQHEELREAHERLRREHEATARALAELRAVHQALLRERAKNAQLLPQLEARNRHNEQVLTELQGVQETLRREHEAAANALREVDDRHDALLQDRQWAAERLDGIRRRLMSLS